MAQLNITLNQEEILQLLSDDRNEAFKKLLQESLNSLLKAESEEQLKAAPYERTEERTDSRNGTRERELTTRIGTLVLTVPRHRNVPFKTLLFENYSRSEAALIASMAEMVVNGVSTRKVAKIVETLCGTSFSKSAVSEYCKALDEKVFLFKNRPLEKAYPFVSIDATYFKVREKKRTVSKAFMIAYATSDHGKREIIGFDVYPRESKDTWEDFLKGLKKRGLMGVMMITSDAHEGIRYAADRVFPEVSWQRCQFHFARNIVDKAPKKYQEGLARELHDLWCMSSLEGARKKRDGILDDYMDVAPAAMECLEEGFNDAVTVLSLPPYLQKYFRTTNHIERLNAELKRRSKVIGVFPNEASLLRLMGSVLEERHTATQTKSRAMFTYATYKAYMGTEMPLELLRIASNQHTLLAA